MGIHYSQVLHKEPELVNNFLGTFRGLFLSPNTDLIETVSDGLVTPSKSDIKCKIRLYLQIPGIIWLIFYSCKKVHLKYSKLFFFIKVKKGLKKPWLTRLLLLNSKGAIFTAESIYTRHLKFGIKYSVNGKKKKKNFSFSKNAIKSWERSSEIN